MTEANMQHLSSSAATQLGKRGPIVFPVGLGCMAFSGPYGASDDMESVATIRHAIERGITLLDTADFYGSGHNELLLRRGIEGMRDNVQLSVKCGMLRGPDGASLGIDTRPNSLKNFATYSLKRLGVEVIDIYRPARLDPNVPIEETVGAIADLIQAGYVRHIGLSEVGVETLQRANRVHPIVDLQIEYSLATRGPESTIFPALAELGMSATLYGVFSRGLLTGSRPAGAGDQRQHLPRFVGEQGTANSEVVLKLNAFSAELGMTPAQVALAWVLAKQPGLVPIVGARTRLQLDDTLVALEKPLAAGDVLELERILPADAIQGTRYPVQHMKALDSER